MIEIPAGHRNMTVSFAAIDYTDNRDILYRTRLDGSPWTGADRTRSADPVQHVGRHAQTRGAVDRPLRTLGR